MLRPKRRFDRQFKRNPLYLDDSHPAVSEGRTIFRTRVFHRQERVLKSGEHQRKIGSHVTKGRWAGMPIYTLTLEERATCPQTCQAWNFCYGNHMHHAPRQQAGEWLENKLCDELTTLNQQYPSGFVVRLHVLGDFYSPEYVMLWAAFMRQFPALHVFGYTARDPQSAIGLLIDAIRQVEGDRWWMRWSHRDKETWLATGDRGIVCPVQTGKTDCCGTCALCWTMKKPIRFLIH